MVAAIASRLTIDGRSARVSIAAWIALERHRVWPRSELADLAAELGELKEGAGALDLEGDVVGGIDRELFEERDRGRQELLTQLEVVALRALRR